MSQDSACPNCGRSLPAGAPAGLCPGCLLDRGLETVSGDPPGTPPFEPLPVEEVARLFPQLEVISLLGAGGMGAVYRARQPALDRQVALKLLPPKGAGGTSFEERFSREARALARLSHPNIVSVHEFGQVNALHYFIMEYVDGASLRQLEQAGRLSAREALRLIPQICDALQYAHDEGVVHRDIKPENVLVDRKGRVKIADFVSPPGLVRLGGRCGGDFVGGICLLVGARSIRVGARSTRHRRSRDRSLGRASAEWRDRGTPGSLGSESGAGWVVAA